jgi:hypothetical protein
MACLLPALRSLANVPTSITCYHSILPNPVYKKRNCSSAEFEVLPAVFNFNSVV